MRFHATLVHSSSVTATQGNAHDDSFENKDESKGQSYKGYAYSNWRCFWCLQVAMEIGKPSMLRLWGRRADKTEQQLGLLPAPSQHLSNSKEQTEHIENASMKSSGDPQTSS